MKYSLVPKEDYNKDEQVLGERNNYNLLVDCYPEAFVSNHFQPNLMLSFFWFIRKTSALVLVERNQYHSFSKSGTEIHNIVITIAKSITDDIIKKVTHDSQERIDFDDDLDFEIFGIQEDLNELEDSHSPKKDDSRFNIDTSQFSVQKPS